MLMMPHSGEHLAAVRLQMGKTDVYFSKSASIKSALLRTRIEARVANE